MPGDRGFDPMGLGAEPEAMKWYRQAELQHARWAMLGAAGVLAQSVLVPSVFWYDAALHLPEGLGPVNLGSLLAVQFLMLHFVEVRRWVDLKNPGAASQDPIFTNNKLPKGEVGYPGGVFDPINMASEEMKTKELKNGRCVKSSCDVAAVLTHPSPALPWLPSWASLFLRRRQAKDPSRT